MYYIQSASVFCCARFKKADERVDYITAMASFLPLLYGRMKLVLGDESELSVTLQHHILKIFFATMQVRGEGRRGREGEEGR